MVIILVFLTVAALVVVDGFLAPRRPDLQPGRATMLESIDETAPLYLHPGHTWARIAGDGTVLCGSDGFALGFAGSVVRIAPPSPGSSFQQGEKAWTLVSRCGRRLDQALPVAGEIVEVNWSLISSPARLGRQGETADWLVRVRPAELRRSLGNLLHGRSAELWQDAGRSGLLAALSPEIGRAAADGGLLLERFGDLLDEAEWKDLRRRLFPDAIPAP